MLANFVIELVRKELESISNGRSKKGIPSWVLYFDGWANKSGGSIEVILEGSKGVTIEHSLCFDFQTMNNQVEYAALIVGLKLAKDIGVRSLKAKNDLQLVVD